MMTGKYEKRVDGGWRKVYLIALGIVLSCVLVLNARGDEPEDIPTAAQAVRTEALRPNVGPEGRPLPLLAHWHRLSMPLSFQVELIRDGHPILPWVLYVRHLSAERVDEDYGEALKTLREWKLPFVLLHGGQPEADFYQHSEYKDVPADETGEAIGSDGERLGRVSPFGPVQAWKELGRKWTDNPGCRRIQQIYPNPPFVGYITNNEARRLRSVQQAERSGRYLDKYGEGRSKEFRTKVISEGYAERYGALGEGMREGLTEDAWRNNWKVMAYNPFGIGFEAGVQMWDGGIPEAYDNHWQPNKRAYYPWSVQSEMMNLAHKKEAIRDIDPDYWLEVVFWDGDGGKARHYEEDGITYTPELYGGWAQYVMWTVRPRVAREWRGHGYRRDEGWWPYFATIMRAVNLVHHDPVLRRFWRHGELVVAPDVENPVTHGVPENMQDEDRWYSLPTDVDPPKPWEEDARLPVYALARVVGEAPEREWLLYAHAGTGEDKEGVEVTIPDYGTVTVDVAVQGSFYHIREVDDSVSEVGDPKQVVFESNRPPETNDNNYSVIAGEELKTTKKRFTGGIPGVLHNDIDEDGDPMRVELVEGPQHGELDLREDGTFSYRNRDGFTGEDSFTYRAHDFVHTSETATVNVTVREDFVRLIGVGDEGFKDVSRWGISEVEGAYEGSFRSHPARRGGESTATWTVTDLPEGRYDVYMTWPDWSYRMPRSVPVELLDGDEPLESVEVDQRKEARDEEFDGHSWEKLADVQVESGTLKVVLSNNVHARWVMADAVRVAPSGGGEVRIVDNTDEGFSTYGRWVPRDTDSGFGDRSVYIRGTDDPDRKATATWSFEGLEEGTYEVFATWVGSPNGSSRVTYSMSDGDQHIRDARRNHSEQITDLWARGAPWKSLGKVNVASGDLEVELDNMVGKKGSVYAGAIALMSVDPE